MSEPSVLSTIASVTPKQGRAGRLVLVTVRHEISGPQGLAILDEHDIVYREAAGRPAPDRAGDPAPADPAVSEAMTVDPVLLFRYSALTFNGHRIHYDRDYATRVEGYPGLVVHGPLLATLLVDLAVRSTPGRSLERFAFRAHHPVFDGMPFTLCGSHPDDTAMELWVADGDGVLAMNAEAGFRGSP